MNLTPKELDAQSPIKVERWVDIDSEECALMDNTPEFTKQILKLGFQSPAFLFLDSDGRIFGDSKDGKYYPFHFEYGKQLIGYRICKKAAN